MNAENCLEWTNKWFNRFKNPSIFTQAEVFERFTVEHVFLHVWLASIDGIGSSTHVLNEINDNSFRLFLWFHLSVYIVFLPFMVNEYSYNHIQTFNDMNKYSYKYI